MIELQPFAAEREWTVDGIPVLSAAVSVPQPMCTTDKIPRRLHRYYQLQCRSFLKYCEKELLPRAEAEYRAALAASSPLPAFHAELSYQVTYHDSHFLSLYTQSREAIAHQKLTMRRSDTWDLTTGYPVPLSDLFAPRSAWKRQLLKLIEDEIRRQETAGIAQYAPHWKKKLRQSFNPQNYYLTADGLAFFFPMYTIAPSVEGIPVFVFPYDQITLSAFNRPC